MEAELTKGRIGVLQALEDSTVEVDLGEVDCAGFFNFFVGLIVARFADLSQLSCTPAFQPRGARA